MTEVVISKKSLFAGLLALALLAAACFGVPFLRQNIPVQEATTQPALSTTPAMLEANQSAREAALAGALAFYTVDYRDQDGWLHWSSNRCGVPNGDETKVTYRRGVLAIIQALGEPELAQDFWQAYTGLLGAFRQYGRSSEIKELFE